MPAPAKKPVAKSAAKPAETKPTAKSTAPTPSATAAQKATATKPAATAAAVAVAKPTLSPAERRKMIAETAYYLAQKRGFTGGNELSDWMAAEKQVDTLVAKRG